MDDDNYQGSGQVHDFRLVPGVDPRKWTDHPCTDWNGIANYPGEKLKLAKIREFA
jgi:hypothetical protein